MLHLAKEETRTREGNGHRTELAENLVPFLDSGSFLRWWNTCKDLGEAFLAVLREANNHCGDVDDLTKNELDCSPRAVTSS